MNDIAVLGLASTAPVAPLNIFVKEFDDSYIGLEIRLIGFGATAGDGSGKLRKRTGTTAITSFTNDDFRFRPAPAQTCVGDAGGPAVARIGDHDAVIGLTSSGESNCATYGRDMRIDRLREGVFDADRSGDRRQQRLLHVGPPSCSRLVCGSASTRACVCLGRARAPWRLTMPRVVSPNAMLELRLFAARTARTRQPPPIDVCLPVRPCGMADARVHDRGRAAMLFIVSAVGLVGAFVIGLDGLMLGSAGELERIVAIACFAFAAAGLVGMMVDDGWRAKKRRGLIGSGEAFQLVAAAPILAIMVGTFFATLLPAIYVMLPFFAISGPAATKRRAARAHPVLPGIGIPATPHVPAYT